MIIKPATDTQAAAIKIIFATGFVMSNPQIIDTTEETKKPILDFCIYAGIIKVLGLLGGAFPPPSS